jgi:hypothetical protein
MTVVNAVNTTWHPVQPQSVRGSSKPAALNRISAADWDEAIASYSEGSFFHGAAWIRALQAAYGYEPKHFAATDEAGIRFLVPLMEVRSRLTGVRGVSMPFSDFCEPLVRDGVAGCDLRDALIEFGREQSWKYLECRGGKTIFQDAAPSARFYTHDIDLGCSEEELWQRFAPSDEAGCAQSRNERRLCRGIFRIAADSRGLLPTALPDSAEARPPPQPWSFFQALFDHAISKESGSIFLARHSGKPIAGALFVHFGRKAVFKYGASDPETLSLRANNLVMWEAIRWYARRGFSELNLGRTEIENHGLRRYKLGWRVEERIQNYYRFDYAANAFVVAGEREPSPFAKSVFRWLPPRPARLIGALLYRHVA